MRWFGLLGLVLALVIVGVLVKKQLAAVAPVAVPGATTSGPAPATVRQQSQQIQDQYRQALDAAVKSHPMPDDK